MTLASLAEAMTRARADKEALIQRFVRGLPPPVEGWRDGDPETRITFHDRLPWEDRDEDTPPRARWRIVTAGAGRLYPVSAIRQNRPVKIGSKPAI